METDSRWKGLAEQTDLELLKFNMFVDTFFCVEVGLTFFVGIIDKGTYVVHARAHPLTPALCLPSCTLHCASSRLLTPLLPAPGQDDMKSVARSYLSGRFWFDVVTSLPTSWADWAGTLKCASSSSSEEEESEDVTQQVLRFMRVLKPIRLVKLLRIFKVARIFDVLDRLPPTHPARPAVCAEHAARKEWEDSKGEGGDHWLGSTVFGWCSGGGSSITALCRACNGA